MVIGGLSTYSLAEFVDISGASKQCPSVIDIPEITMGTTGTFIDGLPFVCGGWDADFNYVHSCYTYNNEVSKHLTAFATGIRTVQNYRPTGGL